MPVRHRVFISYQSDDSDLAARLQSALEEAGLEVWRDEERIGAGEELKPAIADALESCGVGLCLISDAYLRSQWCQHEAALLWRHARLFPVRTSPDVVVDRIGGVLAGLSAPALGDRRGFADEAALVAAVVRHATEDPHAPLTPARSLRERFGNYLVELWADLARLRMLALRGDTERTPEVLLPSIYTRLDVEEAIARRAAPPDGEDPAAMPEGMTDHRPTAPVGSLRLDAAYARDLTERRFPNADAAQGDTDSRESEVGWSGRSRGDTARLSLLEAAAGVPRLVVLGAPGAGKSTFARFLALCLAGELLERREANLEALERVDERPADEYEARSEGDRRADTPDGPRAWPHGARLPLFVELASFVRHDCFPREGRTARASQLVDYLAAAGSGLDAAGLATFLRDAGEAVLIVDGLDETPNAIEVRGRIRDVLRAFVDAYPGVRVLVTSRPYAYERDAHWRLDDLGFQTTTLAPFDDRAIDSFIDAWHAAARLQGLLDLDMERRRAAEMKRALADNPHLRPFAERPLLLTMMADLNVSGAGALSGGRVALYERATELWVDRWNYTRGREGVGEQWEAEEGTRAPSLSNRIGLRIEQVREALEELAFTVHETRGATAGEAPADITRDEVLGALDRRRCGGSPTDVSLTADVLSQRSGILVEVAPGVYQFPHRSFQEYLAACELRRRGPDEMYERLCADPELWREPIVMAIGKLADQPYVAWPFIDRAVSGAGGGGAPLSHALTTGTAVAEHAMAAGLHTRYEPQLDRLAARLMGALERGEAAPSDRVEAGRLLARIGRHGGRMLDTRAGVGVVDGVPAIDWVEVPAGTFLMGSAEDDEDALPWEKPAHEVAVEGFRLSRYPITNAQFAAFVEAGGYGGSDGARSWWTAAGWEWVARRRLPGPVDFGAPFDSDNHPVVGVSWFEAVAFCGWLSARLGHDVRLPTEAEWEHAARGGSRRVYPWGDEFDEKRVNSGESGLGTTSAVGAFRNASPYGIEDLAGNAWEWCCAKWRDSYREPPRDDLETEGPRVVRGGSFRFGRRLVRCAFRRWLDPDRRAGGVGFRVVAPFSDTLESEPSDL